MPEEVYTLTFPMPRESESASRLKSIISDKLPLFSDDYSEDILSEYITMLVCNGKSQRQAIEDLTAFLGKQSWEFVACLWEILLKDFSQGKQENYASEPNTSVDFGSLDTLIEKGLSSTRHDDCDHKATYAANLMNDKLISVATPTEYTEGHVSSEVNNMKILQKEIIDSPGTRAQPKEKEDWNSSGFNYSRNILRSVIVSAIKQPCGLNRDKLEKSMDEGSGILQQRLYLPESEMGQWHSQSVPSGGAVSARSHDAVWHQEMMPRVSVWDRLGRSRSNLVFDRKCPTLPKFDIQAHGNEVLQQHEPAFPPAYSEQQSETFRREVPAVGCRKRRYGIPNSVDAPFDEFTGVIQYNQTKQEDVEKPKLLSHQPVKPDLFSEILNVKQKLQQLEIRMIQLKKQKVGELKRSPQTGGLQHQQDVTESGIIHVTNVHYAAKKEAISMLFSKCGAVKNITIVTDPVTRRPRGLIFMRESLNPSLLLQCCFCDFCYKGISKQSNCFERHNVLFKTNQGPETRDSFEDTSTTGSYWELKTKTKHLVIHKESLLTSP